MPGYQNRDGRGRKPVSSARFITANKGRRYVRLSFSEDLMLRLSHYGERLSNRNYLQLHLIIERFPWTAPHAVLLRLSQVPIDGRSYKITKQRNGVRYIAEILAEHFEVRPGADGHTFTDIHWDQYRRGMMLQFPLAAMTDEAQERWVRIERWRKLKEAAAG